MLLHPGKPSLTTISYLSPFPFPVKKIITGYIPSLVWLAVQALVMTLLISCSNPESVKIYSTLPR